MLLAIHFDGETKILILDRKSLQFVRRGVGVILREDATLRQPDAQTAQQCQSSHDLFLRMR